MEAVCTPTTSVQGHGTIAMTYVRQDSHQVETQYGTRTNTTDIFSFTATPADGWGFSHFAVMSTYDYGEHLETPEETHVTRIEEYAKSVSPYTTPGEYDVAPEWPIGEYYGTGRLRTLHKTLTYHIEAVFTRPATNLLINSSTVESPAKLVYDPTTNLLVADF